MWTRTGDAAGLAAGLTMAALIGCGGEDATVADGGAGSGPDGAGAMCGAPEGGGDPGPPARTLHVQALGDGNPGSGTSDDPFRALQDAIDAAQDCDVISVAAGMHEAAVEAYDDPTCGNCLDAADGAQTTVGFALRDKILVIEGAGSASTVLVTGAGYGVLIEDSTVTIRDLAITGGVRSEDGNATDAAVVVRRSTVRLEGLSIDQNDDLRADPDVYPGIAGVVGREDGDVTVLDSVIEDNSWDGVALYRGARALVRDSVIRRGNGAGIGVTWDSQATVINNRVSGYWKGIGSFGASQVVVHNNFVFDQLGWGIIASGESTADIVNNVVTRNGNCGLVVWDWSGTTSGRIVNNIVLGNGTSAAWVCPRVGLVLGGAGGGVPTGWTVEYNDAFDNADGDFVYWDGASAAGNVIPEALGGVDGNLSADALFTGSVDFHLEPGSMCIDAGDPAILDADATRSDLGGHGGPDAAP